jgi:hypothetical protein
MHYIPKRAVGRKGVGTGLKLEEAAKIRYAFLYEPTLISSSPKSLWTPREDGGVYEEAFGVEGELLPEWPDLDLGEMLFAIAMYYHLIADFKDRAKTRPTQKPLYRLRFHALSLAGIYAKGQLDENEYGDVARSSTRFADVVNGFISTARLSLMTIHQQAINEGQNMFAFVRSEERWRQIRELFEVQLASV